MSTFLQVIKSRTILFALLLAVLGVVEQNAQIVSIFFGPQNQGVVMLIISVLVALLRVVTTVPLVK